MHMIENFTQKMNQTPFEDVRLGSLRKDFFSLVSEIWLNSFHDKKEQNIYSIYSSIKNQLLYQNNPMKMFMNYLIDYTGILNGLQKNLSKIFL